MPYDSDWEVVYIDLDALQLVLRHRVGDGRLMPMIIFDTADYHNWKVGDRVDVNPGPMSPVREIQKQMGMTMSEEDYTIKNLRTGASVQIRKNDYEVENAFDWLHQLIRDRKIPQ